MPVTLSDIAKQVGVSHQVVSKVLHGGRSNVGVSSQTRQKVEKVARKMGYRPHAAGQALRNQAFRTVGLLMGGVDQFYLPPRTLTALSRELEGSGYLCATVASQGIEPQSLLGNSLLRARQVDVLLISYVYNIPSTVLRSIEGMGVPVLWLNRWANSNSLSVDEADAASRLVDHLASLGHDRITFLDYSNAGQDPVAIQRLRGFRAACDVHGITAETRLDRVAREDRGSTAHRLLSGIHEPRALIVNSMSAAIPILQAALAIGLRVPDDLAIVSFDDGTQFNVVSPALTCAIRPDEELGRNAGEMAVRLAQNASDPLPSRKLRCEVWPRGSTVPT